MDPNLFEELLNEDEGASLDFKRDQYPFDGANEIQKSELLKDILAFANAWRRTDAYILIDVDDVKGGRSIPVGVADHPDDAKLQQFINSKTNRPISFAYEVFAFEGKQIGVLRIEQQDRPVSLLKDYGKLRRNVVYIRRGSSTDEATPDEIIRMSQAVGTKSEQPVLELELADIRTRRRLGQQVQIESHALRPLREEEIPKYGRSGIFATAADSLLYNERYYSEMNRYKFYSQLTQPIGFYLINQSAVTAHDVRVEISMPNEDSLVVLDEKRFPEKPLRSRFPLISQKTFASLNFDVVVKNAGDQRLIVASLGKIQPKAQVWSSSVFYVGSANDRKVDCEAVIFADNLSEPLHVPLTFEFTTIPGEITFDMLRAENDK
jgi:hypothetical protein